MEADLESAAALAGLLAIVACRPWRWADSELREHSALAAAALAGLWLMTISLNTR